MRTWHKWAALAFALLLLAIVIAADRGTLPRQVMLLYDVPGGDKIGHFLLVGIFAFLVSLSVPLNSTHRPWLNILIAAFTIGLIVAVEELSQARFPSRSASWGDLLSSYAGIAFFCWLAWGLRMRRKIRPA